MVWVMARHRPAREGSGLTPEPLVPALCLWGSRRNQVFRLAQTQPWPLAVLDPT